MPSELKQETEKQDGHAAAAASRDSAGPKATPPNAAASTRFRVGLVGAGYISEFHVSALRRVPNVSIVGITDVDASRSRAAVERFGLPASFPSVKAMVAAGVDVVHVLTPPAHHAAVAVEALELGCHVLVEKPLATSVEECDRIAQAAKAASKRVCVDHSLLYDFFIAKALDAVRGGAIGDLVTVDYLRSSDYAPYGGGPVPVHYRDGGFPFRDGGVHALYLMEAFLGEIQDVHAVFGTKGGDPNLLYDEWRALVTCARGHANIQLSWNVKPLQNVLIAQGTKGVLRADLHSLTLTVKRSTPLPKAMERALLAMTEGLQMCTQMTANSVRFVLKRILHYHGLQMLVADFYRTLASGAPVPVTPEQARSIVDWTERVARLGDVAKRRFLAKFPTELTAKVLVTGASGFIGRQLLRRLLEEGKRVRVLVRREPPAEWMNDPRLEVVLGDLGDPAAVERALAGIEIVYHLGATMSGGRVDFERGTVVGTQNVVAPRW
jgi:predicted dehydrogenase